MHSLMSWYSPPSILRRHVSTAFAHSFERFTKIASKAPAPLTTYGSGGRGPLPPGVYPSPWSDAWVDVPEALHRSWPRWTSGATILSAWPSTYEKRSCTSFGAESYQRRQSNCGTGQSAKEPSLRRTGSHARVAEERHGPTPPCLSRSFSQAISTSSEPMAPRSAAASAGRGAVPTPRRRR